MTNNKSMLRQLAKKLCNNLQNKAYAANMLLENLSAILSNYDKIAIYHANENEINLSTTINYLVAKNKSIYQPIAYKSNKLMRFELVKNDQFSQIFYPDEYLINNEIAWQDLDVILMPLLAVDKYGHRLGKGGGYYDCTLSGIKKLKKRPILIGVGFDCQLFLNETIPVEEWDIDLDYFASELRLIKFVTT